ncbi:MAG TPA: hypothetical protein VL225_13125 [Vicinamibacterales bacterium]|nr:hypothetical protein [Vicinamibacterales bacterium]
MLTIGTQFFPADGDVERRQRRARQALLALESVRIVNLQFADESFAPDGFVTMPVLRRDSLTVTGGGRRRKPIVSEMFDALAAAADGCRYFAFINADIEVTPAAIERILSGGRDGYAFCRADLHPVTREPEGVQLFGLDMFAIDVAWWARERRRFRPYIAGEACWDNVYASLICSHGNGEIVHDDPGILHERHPGGRHGGLFAAYNGYLAALDAPYFSRWATYVLRLQERRAAGAHVDPAQLVQEVFGGPPLSLSGRIRHVGRALKARVRFARDRARLAREEPSA